MSSKAKLSQGAKLSIDTASGSPATWVAIKGIQSISSPNYTTEEIDVTDLDSTGREFIAGLGDAGDLTFDVLLEKGVASGELEPGQEALRNALGGAAMPFKLEFPADWGITVTFNAFVKAFTPNFNQGEAITASVTLRVTGAPVWS